MVMEAATLSSPQRKFNVVPVQKSLSLPSYARASGEGIDHRLIFAALEQKEKVRRKSKIFTREKSSRQNIFCLPIPSSAKCKETSLSSDTSCSSLEYQKPKPLAKTKKEDTKTPAKKAQPQNDKPLNETALTKTSQPELKSNTSAPIRKDALARNVAIRDAERLLKESDQHKGYRSPVDTMRLNVGSSDSMDRSSRSSNDSLSRKERLVAIKARVEAAREKYGNSSSEEESRTTSITRYNSDGVIHRTVRDVKSKYSRSERRLRRRSQDEWSVKKANRKSNLSLCLNAENGDSKPVVGRLSPRTEDDVNNLEIKTDFCPSPNVTDMLKKNYFSDYPSRENVSRFVQARIRHIEDEERKRRSGSDFREFPTRQSPQLFEANSPVTTENRRRIGEHNGLHINTSSFADSAARASPIPRSSQAPTPPPRSPKSITFVNKAFIQHQNASLMHHDSSLEKKRLPQQNAPTTFHSKLFDQFNSKSEAVIAESKYPTDPLSEAAEKQKIRELICSRRKTCGNFDFVDQNIFSDLSPLKSSPSVNSTSMTSSNFSSLSQMKRLEGKGYFSSSEMNCPPFEDPTTKLWKTRWQENEQRREYMFNSLESKRKCNPTSWLKRKNSPSENDTYVPQLFPNSKLSSGEASNIVKQQTNVDDFSTQIDSLSRLNSKDISSLSVQYSADRLSKSEVNIASNEKVKFSSEGKEDHPYNSSSQTFQETENSNSKNKIADKTSATANLESAMEELESVYQSLKISSDNLSDKNNTSNSLEDKNTRKSKYSYSLVKEDIGFKRRSSVCESNLSSAFIKNDFRDLIKMGDRKNNVKPSLFTASSGSVPVSNEKPPDQFSIDELFNDLTQQLDLEQKLLKEPRDNRSQPKVCSQTNQFSNPRPLNPQPSQISIRKEFYDNLSKNNLSQSKKYSSFNENGGGDSQPALVKKKYKAVRSLSENISYLMATANSNPASSKPSHVNNGHTEDNTSKSITIEQYYERVRDPTKMDAKKDLPFKTPSTVNADNSCNPQISNQDEIRHIRVSMDTNNFQSKPVTKNTIPSAKQYARLSSAVSSSQMSPKHESIPKSGFQEIPPTNSNSKDTINLLDETGVDQLINSLLGDEPVHPLSNALTTKDPSPTRHCLPAASPPPSCNSKESSDVLEEGLEKLLNRLLGDVPDRQQSSLLQSKDHGPPTPPPGEMCVMQHLDVIRLKPVPS